MANEKISDMFNGGVGQSTDIIPLVRGGTNMRSTRAEWLETDPGDNVKFKSTNIEMGVIANSGAYVYTTAGMEFWVNCNGAYQIQCHVGGGMTLGVLSGEDFLIYANLSDFKIKGDGSVFIVDGTGNNPFITYVPAKTTDWVPDPPNDMGTAIDRIAHALAGVLGGPIP